MRYAKIRRMDIANGPGVRVTLFTQGCNHHCHNCFNSETWDFNGGKEWNEEIEKKFLNLIDKDYVEGVTILGGDPLCTPDDQLLNLLKKIKESYPNKSIWMWTGYIWEELNNSQINILQYVDVLVDGLFDQSLYSSNLKWRGSSNQRFIDVQKSLSSNSLIIKDI